MLGLCALEVHRAHRANGAGAARIGEEGVGQRHDDVEVLGEREVVQEAEHEQRVRPPEDRVECHRRRHHGPDVEIHEEVGERQAHRTHPGEMQRFSGDRERRGEEHRDHQRTDPGEDQERVVGVRLLAEQPLHALGETAKEREADRDEDDRAERLLARHVQPVALLWQEVGIAERRDHALDQQFGGPGAEDAESPEDRGMHGTGDRVAKDLGLEDPDAEEVPHPHRDRVPSNVVEPSDAQIPDESLDVGGEVAYRDDEDCEEDRVRRVHGDQPEAFACFTAAVRTGRISSTSPTIP